MKPLQGIDTVIIRVSDINISKMWYQEKLQLTTTWEDNKLKLVVLDTDSPTSLTLWQTDSKIVSDKNGSAYPIFRTRNAEDTHRFLISAGVTADEIVTDHVVTYFRFYDPDGNVLEACQVH